MPQFYTPPFDPASLQTQIDAITASASFVTTTIMTVAVALASFPSGAAYRGKYVRVSDLWGLVDGVMRCGYNGRIYYWEPTTQPTLLAQLPVSGNFNILPLASPPILELTGTVPALTTYTGTVDLTNAWPGMVKEVRGSFSSLLGTLNIAGTGIGSLISVTLNANKRFACYDTGSALAVRQLT